MSDGHSLKQVDAFLQLHHIAVAGASRNPTKFGSLIFHELRRYGYLVVPINPHVQELDGVKAVADVNNLPDGVEGIVFVTPPDRTLMLVNQAAVKGIRHIWIQPGADHPKAVDLCQQLDISVIHHDCILMYLAGQKPARIKL